jgi:tetratricopeptide (TPR) repeat protein/DNA-binding winged helix-turn-helix (wHTH) protein
MEFGDNTNIHHNNINPELRKGFQLDDVVVLPNDGEVIRNGKRYHLPPTAMQILLFLCANNERTLSTKELLEFGWGDRKTQRQNLTHAISEIRHALDDHKECPEYIQTLPRKGYRIIANLRELDEKVLYPNAWPNPSDSLLANSEIEMTSSNWHFSVALLKNSKLFSVSFAFIVGTWILLQVFQVLFPIFNLPEWWLKIVMLILVVGFPIVLLFTWLKEIKLKRFLYNEEKDKERKKFFFKQLALDFTFIGVLSIGVGFLSFYLIESIELEQKKQPSLNYNSVVNLPMDDNLIAVLPFTFKTSDELPNYFKATLQGELISSLLHQENFRLVSQRAVNEIPIDSSFSEYVNRLGARYLIDGEITGSSNQFNIKLVLTDASSAIEIWSSSIPGSSANLLQSQKELYRQGFNALALLAKVPKANQLKLISTNDFKAYDNYIQGKSLLDSATNEEALQNAEAHFLMALKFDPEFIEATAGICQTHLEQYQLTKQVSAFELAQTSCKSLLNVKQLKFNGLVALGTLNQIQGEYNKAISLFSQVLETDPDNLKAIIGTAESQDQLGNTVESERLFQKAIVLEPGYWNNYYSLGKHYFNNGKFKAAVEQFLRVTLLKPNYEQGFNSLGGAYYMMGKYEEASVAWERSIEIKPSANNYSNLGSYHFFKKQFAKAIENYKKAISLKPNDPIIWGNLGDAYQFSKDYEKAHQAYQNGYNHALRQLEINQNEQYIQGMIVRYQSELGQCDAATTKVNDLTKNPINDPYLYYDMSLALLNCNHIEESKKLISKAVELGYSQELLSRDIQFKEIFQNP